MAKTEKKVERRGGYRANAGRPPGGGAMSQRRKLMKQITLDMLKREVVPLRVMLQNMDFYDQDAQRFEEMLAAKLPEIKMDPEQLLEALRIIEKLGDARMKAQHCAMQAAPYCHGRFAHIHHTSEKKVEVRVPLPPDDMERVREEFRRIRSQPFAPAPAQIEQTMVEVLPPLPTEDEDA